MTLEKLIQPMELVISSIDCLRERKGSSAKEILKYLEDKYDVSAEALKKDVEAGLRRGVSFGLINQKGGLYQLNEILRSPLRETNLKIKKSGKVIKKNHTGLKKLKLGKLAKKIRKKAYMLQNRKKKAQGSKGKKVVKTKKGMKTRNSRRLADVKRRKLNRQKSKTRKTQKFIKQRKTNTEVVPENESLKTEGNSKV